MPGHVGNLPGRGLSHLQLGEQRALARGLRRPRLAAIVAAQIHQLTPADVRADAGLQHGVRERLQSDLDRVIVPPLRRQGLERRVVPGDQILDTGIPHLDRLRLQPGHLRLHVVGQLLLVLRLGLIGDVVALRDAVLPGDHLHGLDHRRRLAGVLHLGNELGDGHGRDRAEKTRVVVVRQEGSGRRLLAVEADAALVLVVLLPVAVPALVHDIDHRRIQVRADDDVDRVAIDALGPGNLAVGEDHADLPFLAVHGSATAIAAGLVLDPDGQALPLHGALLVVPARGLGRGGLGAGGRVGLHEHDARSPHVSPGSMHRLRLAQRMAALVQFHCGVVCLVAVLAGLLGRPALLGELGGFGGVLDDEAQLGLAVRLHLRHLPAVPVLLVAPVLRSSLSAGVVLLDDCPVLADVLLDVRLPEQNDLSDGVHHFFSKTDRIHAVKSASPAESGSFSSIQVPRQL